MLLIQTAGAAAHVINQPLSVLLGSIQLLSRDTELAPAQRERLNRIYEAGQRIGEIVRKIGSVRQYITKPYLEGVDIVDFDAAAREESEARADAEI